MKGENVWMESFTGKLEANLGGIGLLGDSGHTYQVTGQPYLVLTSLLWKTPHTLKC